MEADGGDEVVKQHLDRKRQRDQDYFDKVHEQDTEARAAAAKRGADGKLSADAETKKGKVQRDKRKPTNAQDEELADALEESENIRAHGNPGGAASGSAGYFGKDFLSFLPARQLDV